MRFKLFRGENGKPNRYETVPEEKSAIRKDALTSKAPGPRIINVDPPMVNDDDNPRLFHPAISPDNDGSFDSVADEKTGALASQLHSFASPGYRGGMGGTRYEINLADGWYRDPAAFPDSAFFVQNGEIVEVRGPDAFETVASWSSRQETVVREQEDVPGLSKPIRLGSNWVMNPDASGIQTTARFEPVVPGMSLGGRPLSDMSKPVSKSRASGLFTGLVYHGQSATETAWEDDAKESVRKSRRGGLFANLIKPEGSEGNRSTF